MKKVLKCLSNIQECDVFSANICLRYKGDNDFQTYTGACVSIVLILAFGIVFVNKFIVMIQRTDITASISWADQADPSYYSVSTPDMMFGISISGINLNSGPQYFNVNLQQLSNNGTVSNKAELSLVQCRPQMWKKLGDDYENTFYKLQMNLWLCPQLNQTLELKGKYTSDISKFVKILISDCDNTTNPLGCYSRAQIVDFNKKNQFFEFTLYYLNTKLQPSNQDFYSYYLDDKNYYTFSLDVGTGCNMPLQQWSMTVNYGLTPFEDIRYYEGLYSEYSAKMFSSYTPYNGQYLRYYLVKQTYHQTITQNYYRFDQLLSYIGGLFGIIAMAVGIPLQYYNICCYQLSLANQLFTYNKPKLPKQSKNKSKQNGLQTRKNHQTQTGLNQEPQNAQAQRKEQVKEEPHSVDGFNFLIYLLFMPFFILKTIGWKSLHSSKFTPYWQAIQQVRKQIDIGRMFQRFIYLQRASKTQFDHQQRSLLHMFPKQNIWDFEQEGIKFKLKKKINKHFQQIQQASTQIKVQPFGMEELYPKIEDVRLAYLDVVQRKDPISRRIIQSVDPRVIYNIQQMEFARHLQTLQKHQLEQSRQQIVKESWPEHAPSNIKVAPERKEHKSQQKMRRMNGRKNIRIDKQQRNNRVGNFFGEPLQLGDTLGRHGQDVSNQNYSLRPDLQGQFIYRQDGAQSNKNTFTFNQRL